MTGPGRRARGSPSTGRAAFLYCSGLAAADGRPDRDALGAMHRSLKRVGDNRTQAAASNYLRCDFASVRTPVVSGIAKRVYRHISQDVCPFNVKFAKELKETAFVARAVLAEKDARTLARELLAMTQDEFSAAFKGSPMKRAKLRGLKRNAAVVLGNNSAREDIDVLSCTLDHPEPLVRKHVAWALGRLGAASAADVLRRRLMAERDASVIHALDSALAELQG